ncbi:SufD family Fe-S cluster assembly protein [Candidatus Woesebacteria bacterium]|nr:SufD family Fe-S cluster assembly protein [Candidatus Woesebacteria bacterium]
MQKHVITIPANTKKVVTLAEAGHYEINLVGEGAHVDITGTFLAEKTEVVAVTVIIHHQAAHTSSNTLMKGVARDAAQIQFAGRIIVAEHCPDTNAFLTERILLLSDEARAQAIPDLEILTDDVKCSHAASISYIPESQLFYLMSRGIHRKAAEDLLVAGFLEQ